MSRGNIIGQIWWDSGPGPNLDKITPNSVDKKSNTLQMGGCPERSRRVPHPYLCLCSAYNFTIRHRVWGVACFWS